MEYPWYSHTMEYYSALKRVNYWYTVQHEYISSCLHSVKEGSKKRIYIAWFHGNKLQGNENESMWQKQNSGSPEDRWEEQRGGRSVDIREMHDVDSCGDNFMGVYLCQDYSNDIFYIFTFLKIKFVLHCCTHFCSTAKRSSPIHTCSLSYILFHHGLSQETGYSSLCYRVGPHCLSILNVNISI